MTNNTARDYCPCSGLHSGSRDRTDVTGAACCVRCACVCVSWPCVFFQKRLDKKPPDLLVRPTLLAVNKKNNQFIVLFLRTDPKFLRSFTGCKMRL